MTPLELEAWATDTPKSATFEAAWRARLERAPHAHFALDPAFLAWRAAHGERAFAVLAQSGDRRAAFVLREQAGGLVGGWPWRWQVVIEDPARALPAGLTPAETSWVAACAVQFAAGRRLTLHLPGEPGSSAFAAGSTYLNPLDEDDDAMLGRMDGDKRRTIRKAGKSGWSARLATDLPTLRAFADIQRDTHRRRGESVPPIDEAPADGEGWREWQLPWMRLLVAERDGTVEAGSGFGWAPGGMLDYRENASTDRARREGANALLAFEAMRLGRDAGLHWINWGGATLFKRDMGGARVPVACRLGGSLRWVVPNRVQLSVRRARSRVGATLRRLGARGRV